MGLARIWKRSAITAMGALFALAAAAQTPPSPVSPAPPRKPPAQAGDTSKEPVDITADHGELFNDERRAVYTGNVEAIWGTDRLRTPQLTIFFAKKDPNAPQAKKPAGPAAAPGDAGSNFGKIERMEAEATVYFTTPTQNAKGDHGTYLAGPNTITLTGNVVLVQDKNVSTGDKLVIDRTTDHSTLYSNNGRVRGVFYQEDAAPGAPGAAKPAAKSPGPPRP